MDSLNQEKNKQPEIKDRGIKGTERSQSGLNKRMGRPSRRKISGITKEKMVDIYLQLERSKDEVPTRLDVANVLNVTEPTVTNYLSQVGIDGMDGLKLRAEEVKKENKEKKP